MFHTHNIHILPVFTRDTFVQMFVYLRHCHKAHRLGGSITSLLGEKLG